MGATAVNVGVTCGLTVMVKVVVVAHCPVLGVKVYVVVVVLLSAGAHVPEIPLFDVVGKAATVAPAQIGATAVKVGVTCVLTVMVKVVVVAHCPALGVKVYVVVAVLLSAGDHVPEIPLFDVVGNAAKVAPEQIGATAVKVGVTCGLTVIVKVVVVAHCPVLGVKVYVVVVVLFSAGAQAPVIPLFDVVGNAVKVAPEQIGATAVNVGVTCGLTVMVKVVVVAHCPAVGVKVYVVVAVLFNAGAQVPVIPLFDVVGNAANVAPEHIGAATEKIGAVFELFTVMVKVVVVAHCPAFGVKV